MRIAKGIKGIRNLTTANRAGWHIVIDNESSTYTKRTIAEIFAGMGAKRTFIGFYGNVLVFTDLAPTVKCHQDDAGNIRCNCCEKHIRYCENV